MTVGHPAGPRVLHLFANYKWTGPADPAIRCAARLRAAGADVVFAQAGWTLPDAEHRMRMELKRSRMPVITGLELRKHFRPWSVARDVRALAARLRRGDFDVLHTHLLGDHLVAALARRRARVPVTLVRSLYDPEPPPRGWRERLAFAVTDGVVAPTSRCAELCARRFGLEPSRVLHQEPVVEVPAPDPGAPARGSQRARLGIGADDPVVGITARIQPHRRFDLLWEVARKVVDALPAARFVLLGRGNEIDTRRLVTEPVRRLGLEANVCLPGYLHAPEYDRALACLDAFLFLVPGSDGTCRAVREAMVRGLPVVATPRGMLPEILDVHAARQAGVVAEETAEDIAAALLTLLRDRARLEDVGAAARAKATGAMDPVAAATRLLSFYARLGGNPG